ncbi:MAG: sugar-transfer associated ATP-grasp domain-containing protein, partial [bacterium]|nr:sugar-transfer associated ATP-grasp domain-containing protein [bacterium]
MTFRSLKKQGVLGMNARIGNYMNPLNPRQFYPYLDNKVLSAKLAQDKGIPTPKTYFVFETNGDVRHLEQILAHHPSFVVKPAHGYQGKGVIVIDRSEDTGGQTPRFVKAGGEILSFKDLRYHILQTMSGLYSLSGFPDQVLLQYRVKIHPTFHPYIHHGVPDIRVIVYLGYPVMAMTRLPTQTSDGRANLHQGAVGAGIN